MLSTCLWSELYGWTEGQMFTHRACGKCGRIWLSLIVDFVLWFQLGFYCCICWPIPCPAFPGDTSDSSGTSSCSPRPISCPKPAWKPECGCSGQRSGWPELEDECPRGAPRGGRWGGWQSRLVGLALLSNTVICFCQHGLFLLQYQQTPPRHGWHCSDVSVSGWC